MRTVVQKPCSASVCSACRRLLGAGAPGSVRRGRSPVMRERDRWLRGRWGAMARRDSASATKAVETLGAVLCLEEFHRALIHHAAARLAVTKACVEPIIDAVIKGIRVRAGHTVRSLPHGLAQWPRKRIAYAMRDGALGPCRSVKFRVCHRYLLLICALPRG